MHGRINGGTCRPSNSQAFFVAAYTAILGSTASVSLKSCFGTTRQTGDDAKTNLASFPCACARRVLASGRPFHVGVDVDERVVDRWTYTGLAAK